MKLFDDLESRGLVKQTTDLEAVRGMLNGHHRFAFYIGFDPTADSLHVGHLLQLITVKRLLAGGHHAVIVLGGATALIGDPSGKTEMRKMLTAFDISKNCHKLSLQIENILGTDHVHICNNLEWFEKVNFLEFLREIGPHFSVNNMLRAECFKSRLEGGLSFLEFNYMLLQAFDFLHLSETANVLLQIGGDDQWSNMLAGIDLIRRKSFSPKAFAMTFPLLLNSDGTKMGKTEKGAVWLDRNKTSVWDFFQFWRNIPDSDLEKCIAQLTFHNPIDLTGLGPEAINAAKKGLAFELTKMVHGEEAAKEVHNKAEGLFENKDMSSLEAVFIEDGVQLIDVLVKNEFAKSRTEARNLIGNRGVSINDQTTINQLLVLTQEQFGKELIIRKGKKKFGRFVFKD